MPRNFWTGWDFSYVRGAGAALSRLADQDHDDRLTNLIDEEVVNLQASVGKWHKKHGPPPTYDSCVDKTAEGTDGLEPSILASAVPRSTN